MAVLTQDDAVQAWIERMELLGLIASETRRLIIDIPLRGVVKVYSEHYGDPRILTVEMANMLKGVDVIGVMDLPKETISEPLYRRVWRWLRH